MSKNKTCVSILQFIVTISYVTIGNYGADILAIMPTASWSHQVPFRPLWRELAKRGHNITLVTTNPMKDPTYKNVTEIDISYGYDHMKKYNVVELASDDSKSLYEVAIAIGKVNNESDNVFFQSAEGQNLIHNKGNHFDLLIVEAQLPTMMVFSWWYQIPFIGVSSLDCAMYFHDAAGNLVHPVVTPDVNLDFEDIKNLTFWERFSSFSFINIFRWLLHARLFPSTQNNLKHYFGEDVPTLPEILSNISMLFIATNPIFHTLRPLMPNTITIGNGMHMENAKPLQQDLETFLDEANNGAIYFSLGSNLKSQHLNDSTVDEFLEAFSSLPYKIVWKFDRKFRNVPSNIFVREWFPSQPDILRHPNVKVFITQGGLQSMQESVYCSKPMIGIPFFGDQHMNIRRMVDLGYGLKLHKYNITKESIREAVIEIMRNPKYTEKARELGKLFKDVDKPNVETAVWWTEYVIRHKGARHFRNPVLDMPLWKYYMLDVIGVIASVVILVVLLIVFSIKFTCRLLKYLFVRKNSKEEKVKKKKPKRE